jgi:DNA ligase-associated metallophosphoesterase
MQPATAETDTSCGRILFQGEQFFCDHQGGLFWPEQNCLIVSDLHLEKGAAMAAGGNLMPPYDTGETLNRLADCIARWRPEKVICLGDSFHRDDSASSLPLQYRIQLSQMMRGKDWLWITGNHDPDRPAGLQGDCLPELALGPLNFRHEQMPAAGEDLFSRQTGEISGHLHPSAVIHRRNKRLRRRCFAGDHRRLILPAFGAFTGGLNISHRAYAGLFDRDRLQVWMLGHKQIYQLSASQLSQ